MALKTEPIWLGSSTKLEVVPVKPIRQVVPPEMHGDEFVQLIERMETQAINYEAAKKYVQAAECLEQAINRRLGFLGERHPELLLAIERHVCNCNYWGIQCLHARQYSTSLELLKKAQAMTEAELVPAFKRRICLRAMTFNNLCCYFHERGKLNAALQCVDRALKTQQRYKDNQNTARTHLNMGVLLSIMMRHEEAMEHSECAVALLQEKEQVLLHQEGTEAVSGEGADPALKARYEEIICSLVIAYHNTGVELSRIGRHDQALDFLNHATQIGEYKLGGKHPYTLAVKDTLNVTAKAHPPSVPFIPPRSPPRVFQASDPGSSMVFSQDSKAATATSLSVPRTAREASEILPDIRSPYTPRKPQSAQIPRKPKSIKEMRAMEQIRGGTRGIKVVVPEKLTRPLKDSKASGSYVGGPIIRQIAHGATPLSTLRPHHPSGEDKGTVQSVKAKVTHLVSEKSSAPRAGQIPEFSISSNELPDGYTLPTIIAHYKQEVANSGSDPNVIKPSAQRVQAIAAIKGELMRNQDSSLSVTAHREDMTACAEDSTRGLAMRYVSAAKPLLVQDEAAVMIQKVARGCMARRRIEHQVMVVANHAATRLQRLFRRVKDARKATS